MAGQDGVGLGVSGGRGVDVVVVGNGALSVVVCTGTVVGWGSTVVWASVVVVSGGATVELSPGFSSVEGCGLSVVAPIVGCGPDVTLVP